MEIIKSIIFGIIEGVTEWLPISSTGHMIILEEIVKLNVSESFWELFLVVIQLAAILAVVVLYFNTIFPFKFKGGFSIRKDVFSLWFKIIFACIPAAVIGIIFEDYITKYLYNYYTVAIALIVFGVAFIVTEKKNKGKVYKKTKLEDITYRDAFIVGIYQVIAAVFPGTSRSGSTILGGISIGLSRDLAARFTFFLAIPVMFGASLLKLLKIGISFTSTEFVVLAVGCLVSFITSTVVIRFLMSYIRKHSFIVFGYYRIVLGIIVLLYFNIF
ncbi:MAG: undecaprenyl-diphosphatase [Clostridiales bacterium]|nr:MAG: undecaprenyl-diphosphatase [Clostridiales bacterium]